VTTAGLSISADRYLRFCLTGWLDEDEAAGRLDAAYLERSSAAG
jgi:hypothetical protein